MNRKCTQCSSDIFGVWSSGLRWSCKASVAKKWLLVSNNINKAASFNFSGNKCINCDIWQDFPGSSSVELKMQTWLICIWGGTGKVYILGFFVCLFVFKWTPGILDMFFLALGCVSFRFGGPLLQSSIRHFSGNWTAAWFHDASYDVLLNRCL